MPFREIKQSNDFIRIKPNGTIIISSSLIPKFFKESHVKIFHDEISHQIGLQPSINGYKVTNNYGSYRVKCAMLSRITQGEFYPIWSDKHKMLVFSYEKKVDDRDLLESK